MHGKREKTISRGPVEEEAGPGAERGRRGGGWRFAIREEFAPWFPENSFGDYRDWIDAKGELLKSEDRTSVRLLRQAPSANGRAGGESRLFVLKVYRYPFWPRLRTWLRASKGELEFRNLGLLRRLNVPAVEPVGYGLERSRTGFVRSCFVITCYAAGTLHLRDWVRREGERAARASTVSREIFRQTGEAFRRLHAARVFLFSGKAKNILMREEQGGAPSLLFIDVPYARSQGWWLADHWAQSRDIGMFFATFLPGAGDDERAPFYEAYLPDPLGRSAEALKREVNRAVRVSRNETLISGLVHRAKKNVRRRGKRHRSRERSTGG